MDLNLQRRINREDEPATPITRVSVHPSHNHVIHCALGFKNPIDITTLKEELANSIMLKIPRFSSLLVVDPHNGTELGWKKIHVHLDDHIIIHHLDDHYDDQPPMSDDGAVNSYLADIAISPPMSLDKPLWEIHIMHEYKCMILRVHHAVADGMALMSLLDSLGRSSSMSRVHDGEYHDDRAQLRKKSFKGKVLSILQGLLYVLFGFHFLLQFIGRCLWVKDARTVISGIEGVELWPRKVGTARFKISDMKAIKKAIPNSTVHDVFYGIIWSGLTKYLKVRHPQALQDGVQLTGLCPISIREQGGIQDLSAMLSSDKWRTVWGNKFAMTLTPITCCKRDLHPLSYVTRAKAVMERKKRSMEARLLYNLGSLIFTLLSSKVGGDLYYRLFSNTSFLISNMAGPKEEISIAGNPVTFIRVTSSSQAQALTLHMVSYMGTAELQIQVAKEVIPDPEFLATCFEDALLEMKEFADKYVPT